MAELCELVESALIEYPSLGKRSLRDHARLLAIGWLVTNIALSIADLPLKYLLKERLGLSPSDLSLFFVMGNFTNYIKPIARHVHGRNSIYGYEARGTTSCWEYGGGGVFWILLGAVPQTYRSSSYNIYSVLRNCCSYQHPHSGAAWSR